MHDLSVNIREPKVSALETIRQSPVVDSQAMENRGIEVVNVHRVLDYVVTEVIGTSVGDTCLGPPASK